MEVSRQVRESPSAFAALLGVKLHPGQVTWLETRSKVKVAACGRRWGKSYAEAIDLLHFALLHRGSQQFLIAPTFDQVTTIFDYAVTLATSSDITARFVEKVVKSPFPEMQIFGSTIHARSSGKEGQNVRSKGADRVIYDEAAFIPAAARAAIAPLLANSTIAEQVYISSPWGKNYFWELYARGQAGVPGCASFRFPSWDSPYVSQDYLEEQKRDLSRLAFAVEYGAEFADDQNAVFPIGLIESCLVAMPSPDAVPGHRYVIGYDPAKYADRSGVVVIDMDADPAIPVQVLDIAGRDYTTQAAHIERLAAQYSNAPVLVDSTGHEQMLEHLRGLGVNVQGFRFTNESKQELINGLVLAMENHRLLIPRHADLIDELTYYRYELTAAGNVKLGADDRHHDDLVTALALAWQHRNAEPAETTLEWI